MGIFDIYTQQKSHNIEKKAQIIKLIKNRFATLSKDSQEEKNQLIFKNFKSPKGLLPYDLKATVSTSNETFSVDFEGELQNVWILVILIVLSIFLTYGIGVILVIAFAYLQKQYATKFIQNSFEKIKKEVTSE